MKTGAGEYILGVTRPNGECLQNLVSNPDLKAEFHEHLTRLRGVNYDEEMNICLLESRLEMSKSHANVVSFDENVSYLLT